MDSVDEFLPSVTQRVDAELPSLLSVGMGQNGIFEVGFVADGYGSPGELNEVDAVIPGYGELSGWQTPYAHVSFLRNGSPECTERG